MEIEIEAIPNTSAILSRSKRVSLMSALSCSYDATCNLQPQWQLATSVSMEELVKKIKKRQANAQSHIQECSPRPGAV